MYKELKAGWYKLGSNLVYYQLENLLTFKTWKQEKDLPRNTHITDRVFTRTWFKTILWFTKHWRSGMECVRSGGGEMLGGGGEGEWGESLSGGWWLQGWGGHWWWQGNGSRCCYSARNKNKIIGNADWHLKTVTLSNVYHHFSWKKNRSK